MPGGFPGDDHEIGAQQLVGDLAGGIVGAELVKLGFQVGVGPGIGKGIEAGGTIAGGIALPGEYRHDGRENLCGHADAGPGALFGNHTEPCRRPGKCRSTLQPRPRLVIQRANRRQFQALGKGVDAFIGAAAKGAAGDTLEIAGPHQAVLHRLALGVRECLEGQFRSLEKRVWRRGRCRWRGCRRRLGHGRCGQQRRRQQSERKNSAIHARLPLQKYCRHAVLKTLRPKC